MTEDYARLRQEIKTAQTELKDKMKTLAEEFFRESVKGFFEQFPEVESFSWTQYTPYWCDGEPCYFSVNGEFDVKLVGEEDPLEDVSWYGYGNRQPETLEDRIGYELSEIVGSVDDDVMEQLFGDHVRVVVSREGVEVEEYKHE